MTFQPGQCTDLLRQAVKQQVAAALDEDGSADLSAAAVGSAAANARIISREAGVLAGVFWCDEVFAQLDPTVELHWQLRDGDAIETDAVLCTLRGNARSLLRGERCALNFLQTLSGTATITAGFVARAGSLVIKDTRKTLPGLRLAQKYAVACGGGVNHRIGLSDAVLLKDNHVRACGSVGAAVEAARQANPGLVVEVEVASLEQLEEALAARVETILLDNFDADQTEAAMQTVAGRPEARVEIEASGGVGFDDLPRLAAAGVDCVSIGALTKHMRALDLSMQFD